VVEVGDRVQPSAAAAFDAFVAGDAARLRRVLVARYGIELGEEVHADALGWAREHWDRLRAMTNPVGYLYRVAQSRLRRHRPREARVVFPVEQPVDAADPVPELGGALVRLPDSHRVAVLLVHGHGWTYLEAATVLGVRVTPSATGCTGACGGCAPSCRSWRWKGEPRSRSRAAPPGLRRAAR
jgi:DNA-directed RNA polymerase specialized sigma24 family protein